MDVFSYLENREVILTDVFSEAAVASDSGDLNISFKKLGHLFDKKIRTWWDIVTFEQYLVTKIIPRRLRWDLPPNDGLTGEESIKEWFNFFTEKGFELIRFLLSRKQRKKLWLESQIKEITDRIERHKDTSEFIRLSGELKNKLEKWDKETQEKKRKKFLRDVNDFGVPNVYKWQSLSSLSLAPTLSASMDTSEPPPPMLSQGSGINHGDGVSTRTPLRPFSPLNRGGGPTRGRGKNNKNKNTRGKAGHQVGRLPQSPGPDSQAIPPWRTVSNRGNGQGGGRGGVPGGAPPLPTYNYYAPLQNYWEGPPPTNQHFLGQGRTPWRGPPPYPPPWIGDWGENGPPPLSQTPRGKSTLKRKNLEGSEAVEEPKRPRS